ncbi:MAG: hypothetical protein GC179_16760 [Anaerolineaceae bacterium]|nr:hypothetical protein [Anaerolineaceae bacterium]
MAILAAADPLPESQQFQPINPPKRHNIRQKECLICQISPSKLTTMTTFPPYFTVNLKNVKNFATEGSPVGDDSADRSLTFAIKNGVVTTASTASFATF